MAVTFDAIFCDDLRQEVNGKLIAVGIYPDDLVPSILPQTVPISVWGRIQGLEPGQHELHVSIGANGANKSEFSISLQVQEGQRTAHIYVVGFPIEISAPGCIFFTLTGDGFGTLSDELRVREPLEKSSPAVQSGSPATP